MSPSNLSVHLHALCFFFSPLPSLYPGESSHLALNKLKCPHCNYIAKHRRTLKRHLIIHSGVRSFSCDICGKLFTRREHVKRHSLVSSHTHRIPPPPPHFLQTAQFFWSPSHYRVPPHVVRLAGSAHGSEC